MGIFRAEREREREGKSRGRIGWRGGRVGGGLALLLHLGDTISCTRDASVGEPTVLTRV